MKKSIYIYFLILIISIIDMNASNIDYQVNEVKEKKVIFFGNSITQSWSDYTDFFSDNGYFNKGISGQTTDQMLVRFKKDVIDEKADCVVILAGINDLAENNGPISLEDIFKNIKSMVKIANDNNIKVILSSILPAYEFLWNPGIYPSDDIIFLNKNLKDFCKYGNATYVDYHTSMKDRRNGLKDEYTYWREDFNGYDGVHPNKKGYLKMARIISKSLKKIL
jgi:lysophospholipase L1-like esterase